MSEKLKLIQGIFSSSDARELLLTLIQDKINYHEFKNYSRQERFGQADPLNTKRIAELKELKSKVLELIMDARSLDMELEIDATIEISLTKKEKSK
ncbi:MAG: hypothetical protein MUF42_07045 [Cytophagaceae bacterium]|jgi:hypothetical protein|nr:hypothetical protein [Cytophagaceae bacterium]